MWIKVGNVSARLARATDEERSWLRDYLAFPDASARFRTGGKGDGRIHMMHPLNDSFPAGFAPLIKKAAADPELGFEVEIVDGRTPTAELDPSADLEWLRDYQREAVDKVVEHKRGILWLSTGAGKCLSPETPVLLFNGRVVCARDIRQGDDLMGPDGAPRRVLSTTTGSGPMFEIVPHRGHERWSCNDAHVLTLVHTTTGEVVDIPLVDYLRKAASWKHVHKLFSRNEPTAFDAKDTPCRGQIDPYFAGVWLGDGTKDLRSVGISKPDGEIEQLCRDVASTWGLEVRVDTWATCPTYRMVAKRGQPNLLLDAMREELGAVRVPSWILRGSVSDRRELLAGVIDSDGSVSNSGVDIVQKRRDLLLDVVFVARSLGLAASPIQPKEVNGTTYWRTYLSGAELSNIPTRIARKTAPPRLQKKRSGRTGFDVRSLGDGPFAGFTLDGDGRFLLGDFTVTHNTEIAVGLARALPTSWLFLVHRTALGVQAAERFERRNAEHGVDLGPAGVIGEGRWSVGERFTCATFQTLAAELKKGSKRARGLLAGAGGLIVDECHVLPADSFYGVTNATDGAFYRVGLSGTPLARGDRRSVLAVAALGPVIYRVKADKLVAAGVLAKPRVRLVNVEQRESLAATWQGVYGDKVVRSKVRNNAVVAAVQRSEKPCLVFVKEIDHGKQLVDLLLRAGIRADFTWGSHSTDWRKAMISRLVRGDLDALVCSVVFQEGIDIPCLRAVINASGGKSVIASIQKAGRGMRVEYDASGKAIKTEFEVFDFVDKGNSWLEKHARERVRAYQREGYETAIETLIAPTYAARA